MSKKGEASVTACHNKIPYKQGKIGGQPGTVDQPYSARDPDVMRPVRGNTIVAHCVSGGMCC